MEQKANTQVQESIDVLAPKNGIVQDLIAPVQRKANLSDEAVSALRIYETQQCKVVKELDHNAALTNIPDYANLYAELIPEEEIHAGDEDRAIYAFHFDKEPMKTHGVPFKFVVKPVSRYGQPERNPVQVLISE